MSDLWTWAVKAYDGPGVAEACLSLQDHNEQNVPLLLWAAWISVTGRRPDEETIEAACDAARAYDTVIVSPLRAVRRTLKAPIPDVENDHREALRQQVKALELDAERRLMLELEALAPAPSGAPRRAIDGLAETAKLWARVVPRPALTTLADRLPA
ncbi:TIGR02444 family protein [uncultured Brevundimonas sp.]|uniref:TIGR02444 family protein n=1 Tax=uncultured Brevundimonas sp. TaxID=213418 RepID=UPI0025EE7BE9|nr:TIGR02444 family protein [uncultured Brevundimonas sp.]